MFAAARSGTIQTIAGNGEPGYGGDGGSASSASLNEPKHVAVDGAGRLYIADSENHVIRRVDLVTGVIATVAGQPGDSIGEVAPASSTSEPADDDPLGGPTHADAQRFTQLRDLSGTVRFLTGSSDMGQRFGGDGGPALTAVLNFPGAVAVDAEGNLYIADTMNHRVRKLTAATRDIQTIAGTGHRRFSGDGGPAVAAALHDPSALALDRAGNLYIADQGNHRVRRVDLETGVMTTVAGVGESMYNGDDMPALEAGLAGPSGLACAGDGTLYIADTFNNRIRAVDLKTGLIRSVAGDGGDYRYQPEGEGGPSRSLSRPYGIALMPNGDLLITDSDNHLIRKWERQSGRIIRIAGSGTSQYNGDGGSALETGLNYPFGVAVDAAGNVFIADTFNHRIRLIAA
jgi:DNA-binding beta-propeller fold protein YncE